MNSKMFKIKAVKENWLDDGQNLETDFETLVPTLAFNSGTNFSNQNFGSNFRTNKTGP